MASVLVWLPLTAAKCCRVAARRVVIASLYKATNCAGTVASFAFSKAQRLLNPAAFKRVFDAAALRVSSKELLILARPNELEYARLGLVIAKKNVRRASARNRIKRITRESFRHQLPIDADTEASLDIIVLARGGLDKLDNPALHELLTNLWRQLQRKARKQTKE
ncbi:MAG: ribonuclease protein component [Verrucomicrobiaceae bacterium]|nr:ribonuclease protein component [Verrucomicrobiaceae bacterium]